MIWRQLFRSCVEQIDSVSVSMQRQIQFLIVPEQNGASQNGFQDTPRKIQDRTRELFLQHADQLLWSAIVITGDPEVALDSLISAADFACSGSQVFQEFVTEWAKRLVINMAVAKMHGCISRCVRDRELQVKPPITEFTFPERHKAQSLLLQYRSQDLLEALLELNCLDRSVYLLRVLEQWSRQETARKLSISEAVVEAAEVTAHLLMTQALLSRLSRQQH